MPLVCLDGRAETLAAALRYLLFALLGSVLYLLGTALLYGAYGTLDIVLLAEPHPRRARRRWVAAALMTAGLLAKTALFPLHLWLPPAHAGAPAAASAVLSALVVKASFFLIVRLWFDVMPGVPMPAAAQLLAALGAAAILFGSVLALRQARLKLLIAYSTVAQIGYLFLMFPLAAGRHRPWSDRRLDRRHAAAGLARLRQGRDVHGGRPDRRGARPRPHRRPRRHRPGAADDRLRLRPRRPVADGPAAERRLRRQMAAAAGRGRERPVVVGAWCMLAGGLLAGGYVFRVLAPALAARPMAPPARSASRVAAARSVVLALALCSVLLGFVPLSTSAAADRPCRLRWLMTGPLLAAGHAALPLAMLLLACLWRGGRASAHAGAAGAGAAAGPRRGAAGRRRPGPGARPAASAAHAGARRAGRARCSACAALLWIAAGAYAATYLRGRPARASASPSAGC